MESFERNDPKEIFYEAVRGGVDQLVESGALPERYAEGFLKRASRVEVSFEDDEDAFQKARDYISLLQPIIGSFAKCNEEEMRLLAMSGDIGLEIERLGEEGFEGPKEWLLGRLADERTKIDGDISALNKERQTVIERANRETSETSSDEEE